MIIMRSSRCVAQLLNKSANNNPVFPATAVFTYKRGDYFKIAHTTNNSYGGFRRDQSDYTVKSWVVYMNAYLDVNLDMAQIGLVDVSTGRSVAVGVDRASGANRYYWVINGTQYNGVAATLPRWLKLSHVGAAWSAYQGADGINWSQIDITRNDAGTLNPDRVSMLVYRPTSGSPYAEFTFYQPGKV